MLNRISVTWLDSYQYFLDSDMSEQELYNRFYGAYEPTPAMAAGTALHGLLEQGVIPNGQQSDGFSFTAINDLSGNLVLGELNQREVKHVQEIGDSQLVGKIDVETDYAVYDHKLTGSYNPERYFSAWQWRAYLMMRNKPKFVYQVFECKPVKDWQQTVEIKDYHTLEMFAYKGMGDEVKDCLLDLCKMINAWRANGLACKRDFGVKK